jgi:hypothetical protein
MRHPRAIERGASQAFSIDDADAEQGRRKPSLAPVNEKRERRQGCSQNLREEVQTNSTRPAFPFEERACTAPSVQGPFGPGSRFSGKQADAKKRRVELSVSVYHVWLSLQDGVFMRDGGTGDRSLADEFTEKSHIRTGIFRLSRLAEHPPYAH